MKKTLLIALGANLLIIGVAACSSKPKPEEVAQNFAVRFGEFLNSDQKDSIQEYYPDFETTDSLSNVSVDNIRITPDGSDGNFIIAYSPKASITVNVNEAGRVTVNSSKGILAFPKDKIDIAKKTGMWDAELSDIELAERMNDQGFFDYLAKKSNKSSEILSVNSKFKVTESEEMEDALWYEYARGYYTITNNTDQTVKASDYKMNFSDKIEQWRFDEEGCDISYKKYSKPGKEIGPHETIKINGSKSDNEHAQRVEETNHLVGVTILLSPEEIQQRFMSFTGDEYQEYLNSKN